MDNVIVDDRSLLPAESVVYEHELRQPVVDFAKVGNAMVPIDPLQSALLAVLTPASFDAVRQIVREELAAALEKLKGPAE